MPLDTFLTTRLQTLDEHLSMLLALLKEYEVALTFEDDPRHRAKYAYEIERIKESTQFYQKEYQLLQQELDALTTRPAQSPCGVETVELSRKLDQMQKTLLGEMSVMRADLLAHYSQGEVEIVQAMVAHLDQSQMFVVNDLLQIVQQNAVPQADIEQLIQILKDTLEQLPQNTLPAQSEVQALLSKPEGGISHKLKLSLPIIPAILSYEGEIAIDQKTRLVTWLKSHLTRRKK